MPTLLKPSLRPSWEPAPGCRRCPRLSAHRRRCRRDYPEHFNAPVPSRYGRDARLLIVGLAPGARGANRTGLAFHGDASSRTLFQALARNGLAADDRSEHTPAGLGITNVVRCLPPENRPTALEIQTCSRFLRQELKAFLGGEGEPMAVLCLGALAHRSVESVLQLQPQKFAHGVERRLGSNQLLVSSYHTSAQNVNTGRLTSDMLDAVMRRIVEHLG